MAVIVVSERRPREFRKEGQVSCSKGGTEKGGGGKIRTVGDERPDFFCASVVQHLSGQGDRSTGVDQIIYKDSNLTERPNRPLSGPFLLEEM